MRTVAVSSSDEMDVKTLSYISVGYSVTGTDDKSVTVAKKKKISGWAALFWLLLSGIGLLVYLLYGFFRKPQDVVRIVFAVPDDETSAPVFEDEAPHGASEGDADELYLKALKLCILSGRVSLGLIQRNFEVGYVQACKIVDRMECEGYVSSEWSAEPRRVLLTLDEFEKRYGDV